METPEASVPPPVRSAADIQNWLVGKIAERLQVDPSQIRIDEPVLDSGLDSMEFAALVGEMEHWLDCRFRDYPLVEYPTIPQLSAFLAGELAAGRRVISTSAGSSGGF